ncbi:MAG: AIPR family protein, partial [Enterobacter cloacae]|nr:AIPR family protein [Enterobacter cloacae]
LFIGKTLLHGDVLMWLMKTLLTSGCTNQRGAGHSDYYKFLTNETDHTLRRYLFESNVRDFMGLNAVNEDIKLTLSDQGSPDFWLLNNGVTILSTSAQMIGQSIYMEDIQIVNGLQTSESIFRHFDN